MTEQCRSQVPRDATAACDTVISALVATCRKIPGIESFRATTGNRRVFNANSTTATLAHSTDLFAKVPSTLSGMFLWDDHSGI